MSDFRKMLASYGLSCVFHAHIGTGELHLRPLLNLKRNEDVTLFRLLPGDCLAGKEIQRFFIRRTRRRRLRGEFIELMYGSYLYGAYGDLKRNF